MKNYVICTQMAHNVIFPPENWANRLIMKYIYEKFLKPQKWVENMCHMGAKLSMPKCVEKISGSFGICDF